MRQIRLSNRTKKSMSTKTYRDSLNYRQCKRQERKNKLCILVQLNATKFILIKNSNKIINK